MSRINILAIHAHEPFDFGFLANMAEIIIKKTIVKLFEISQHMLKKCAAFIILLYLKKRKKVAREGIIG